MVGDRWRDIEAGRRAGCRTVFVDAGYAERRPEDPDLTVTIPGRCGALDPGLWPQRGNEAMTPELERLKIKIFADGADRDGIAALARNPLDQGVHHQPDAHAGRRSRRLRMPSPERSCEIVPDRPISFEVLSDDFDEMERQALKIASPGATTST